MQNYLNKKEKISTNTLVILALFSAIIFILGLTPFGFIPLGIFKIVTIHIPVIIGSITLGPKKGTFLGLVFGLLSFLTNTIQPTVTSYFFSPIISGNLLSLIVCFVPRILVGIVPHYIYTLSKKITNSNISLMFAGIVGSLTNTVLVLGFIYVFFAQKYAEILDTTINGLFVAIIISVGANAILEAITSAFLTLSISKVLFRVTK